MFQPPVGTFEDIAELDFSAMYPTIMVQHNISAETLFCCCYDNHALPEAGYTICTRHEGLMAACSGRSSSVGHTIKNACKRAASRPGKSAFETSASALINGSASPASATLRLS